MVLKLFEVGDSTFRPVSVPRLTVSIFYEIISSIR